MLNKVKDKIQKEAEEKWIKNGHRGLIALCTGAGKSKIFVNITVNNPKEKWLLVVPTEKLRDENWADEFSKWKKKRRFNSIDRACYASLSKIDTDKYDGICLDECHNITENNSAKLSNYAGKLLCLTATPPEEDIKKDILYKELKCKVVMHIPLDEGVKLGIVSPYNITVIEGFLDSTNKNIETGSKTKKWKSTEFDIYRYKSEVIRKMTFSRKPVPKFMYLDRMRFVYNLPSKTINAKKVLDAIPKEERTLIFCGSIKQAEELCENSWHSQSTKDNLKLFKEGKINRLSAVKILNEGENIPNVDNIFIVQLDSRARNLIQRIGRGVRFREGHTANIYILIAMQTQDENWLKKATEDLDSSNIKYTSINNYG